MTTYLQCIDELAFTVVVLLQLRSAAMDAAVRSALQRSYSAASSTRNTDSITSSNSCAKCWKLLHDSANYEVQKHPIVLV